MVKSVVQAFCIPEKCFYPVENFFASLGFLKDIYVELDRNHLEIFDHL